ncbi:hypothetical protein SLEP1_g47269 [Rubroshorea leprosula]|uniref:Uncharacterized protein n=1 Tax=Rubroshorea leprosula TaxID=152421 RepID=A0AAV5LQ27_9ROSI|nr:hypothetical protein SLEP1_g47269 [Rubroshorea leprosula]
MTVCFSPYPASLLTILPYSPSRCSVPALTVRWKDRTAVGVAMVAGRLSKSFDLSILRRHAFSLLTGALRRHIDASGSDIAFLWLRMVPGGQIWHASLDQAQLAKRCCFLLLSAGWCS